MKKILIMLFTFFSAVMIILGNPLWMRYSAISPDGKWVAFSYKGDIYRVPATGGQARPLTLYSGHDTRPCWSRDSRNIVFASDRYGNFDLFIMPAEGGEARRLTWDSADDFPSDFSCDNKKVIFSSCRRDAKSMRQFPARYFSELYQVELESGRVTRVCSLAMENARFSGSDQVLVYQDRKGSESIWRKHHTSSVTRDIWAYYVKEKRFVKLIEQPGEDTEPVSARDGKTLYFISEKNGSANIFKKVAGAQAEQVTSFSQHPVRFLSAADSGRLCFTYNGEIYTKLGEKEPEKLAISIPVDRQYAREKIIPVRAGATEMKLSPSGKEIAFVFRGDIFVTAVDNSMTRQVTATPEQERSPDFSPDGKSIVYASERNKSWNLYISFIADPQEKYFYASTLIREKPLLEKDIETFQPQYSPDGKEVAFLENRTVLKVINLTDRKIRTIMDNKSNYSYSDGDQFYSWSPDSRWMLVQFQKKDYWNPEVGLINAKNPGEIMNLTESGYSDIAPIWQNKGNVMLWFSDKDGLRSHASTGSRQADVYALFLNRKAWERYKLSKEELELAKEREADKKKAGESAKKKKKKKKQESTVDRVLIEKEGLLLRKARLTIHSSALADARMFADGEKLVYLTRFEKGYDLWVTDIRTRETKILCKLGCRRGKIAISRDKKNVFVLADGKIIKVSTDSGKRKGVSFSSEMVWMPEKEREYLFEHVWRQVKRKFYRPDLHGAKWDYLKQEYARFLPHISNNYDFSDMLSELLGELNASHTGARYYPRAGAGSKTACLGLFYTPSEKPAGLAVTEVIAGGPAELKDSGIRPGVVIESINGKKVTSLDSLARALNRKAGKVVRVGLTDAGAEKRWQVKIKAVSRAKESYLLYKRWIEMNGRQVAELSENRLGYVHVPSMSDPSYRKLFEKVLGEMVNCEGLVIDTRYNGGGDLVDDLSTFLQGKRYMNFIAPSGRRVGFEPQFKWTKPSTVLCSEGNYSDAHCFTWTYKHLKLGKLVGMPVPGTCTFVWWERLLDPTLVFGIPNMGVTDNQGNYLENLQLEPDIKVENLPRAILNGEDLQLKTAVISLLKELDKKREN